MKRKEVEAIIEDRFKIIHKLSHKIIEEFNVDDIHDFRVEIKKLRAFLRLLDEEKEMNKPLLPKRLKTFYGYVGIIRNTQLHLHNIFKYATDYTIEPPTTYIQIIGDEKKRWEKETVDLMKGNDFKDNEDEILKQLPDKLEKSTMKKFLEKKLDELKEQLSNIKDDNTIHSVRKILKDIFYTRKYTHDENLPRSISNEEDLKLLTAQIGDFRDKCTELEFLSDEYLDKIKVNREKINLLQMKEQLILEKQNLVQQFSNKLQMLLEQ